MLPLIRAAFCLWLASFGAAMAQDWTLPEPLAPNPLAWKEPGGVNIGFLSFGDQTIDALLDVDEKGGGLLGQAGSADELEVLIVVASDWKQASFVGVSLFASRDAVDHLDANAGSGRLVDLLFVESEYHPDVYVLAVLSEIEGQQVPDTCVAHAAVTALYQASAEPAFDMRGCMEANQ
ncbi:MAG: hypothetical protein AAF801_10505 [Pseudomonadota bacterium]